MHLCVTRFGARLLCHEVCHEDPTSSLLMPNRSDAIYLTSACGIYALRRPLIVLMDEATSALDTESEKVRE
jgi:hypothetical protein